MVLIRHVALAGISALVPIALVAACTPPSRAGLGKGQWCYAIAEEMPPSKFAMSALNVARQACQTALARNADNQITRWRDPTSSAIGSVRPTGSYKIDGQLCREFDMTIGFQTGKPADVAAATGTACLDRFGVWYSWNKQLPAEVKAKNTARLSPLIEKSHDEKTQ